MIVVDVTVTWADVSSLVGTFDVDNCFVNRVNVEDCSFFVGLVAKYLEVAVALVGLSVVLMVATCVLNLSFLRMLLISISFVLNVVSISVIVEYSISVT